MSVEYNRPYIPCLLGMSICTVPFQQFALSDCWWNGVFCQHGLKERTRKCRLLALGNQDISEVIVQQWVDCDRLCGQWTGAREEQGVCISVLQTARRDVKGGVPSKSALVDVLSDSSSQCSSMVLKRALRQFWNSDSDTPLVLSDSCVASEKYKRE